MPITAQKNSEVSTRERVIMASFHTPITPKRVRVTRQRIPIFFPPICQPKSVAIIMNIDGGIASNPNWMPLSTWSIGHLIERNTSRKL
jgi:hypothetical protein